MPVSRIMRASCSLPRHMGRTARGCAAWGGPAAVAACAQSGNAGSVGVMSLLEASCQTWLFGVGAAYGDIANLDGRLTYAYAYTLTGLAAPANTTVKLQIISYHANFLHGL